MRNDTWIEELACELRARGLPTSDIAMIVVEVEGFLVDSAGSAIDSFGAPAGYADEVATAVAHPAPRPAARGPWCVRVAGVSRAFGRRTVLAGVDLDLRAGEVVALIGVNGSGKSTLLRMIAGFDRPDRGTISVRGTVGYIPQHGGLSPYLRPAEHFELFGAARGLGAAQARHDATRLARELGWDPTGAPIVRDLSGGTRQKLSIVLAMLGGPEVLLLDEPYQGLDLASTQRFWDLLWDWARRGGAVLVVSHTHDALSRANRVVELPVAGR